MANDSPFPVSRATAGSRVVAHHAAAGYPVAVNPRRRPLAVVVLLAVASRLAALPVTLLCPEELRPSWDRLVASHPLPAETSALPDAVPAILVVRQGEPPGARVFDRVLAAPAARMRPDGTAAESEPVRIVPLESVRLPDVALPVDGLTADQPGYPMEAAVSLELEGGDEELRAWYETLPPAPVHAPAAAVAWVGAVGDVMPARGVDAALRSPGGVERVFADTLEVLRSCSFLVGNLEAPATNRGQPARKSYTFRFDARALEPLARAGFTYLSVANNHSFDFGPEGFLDTLEALRSAGIGTAGAGPDLRSAERPFETTAAGAPVKVLSFSAYPVERSGFDGRRVTRAREDAPGVLWLDDEGLAAAAAAFSRGSFNIAVVHGGEEWDPRSTPAQERGYRALVDAGADLVIGSHPHVLQALEAYHGALIAYSLGNFLFPGMDGTAGGEDSAILLIGVMDGAIRYVQEYPVRLRGTTVHRASGQ
jgi:hypothetical protein